MTLSTLETRQSLVSQRSVLAQSLELEALRDSPELWESQGSVESEETVCQMCHNTDCTVSVIILIVDITSISPVHIDIEFLRTK